jgi:hypothetical protein
MASPSDPVTSPQILPISSTSTSFCFSALGGTEVGDDLLKNCAELFSSNYGIWGEKALTVSKFTKPGSCLI